MKKILVVDDDRALVSLLKNRLEKEGFEVESACDAVSALEKIGAAPPDVILLDILMPGVIGDNDKYGASLCDALKRDDAYSNIPIIIVSALKEDSSPVINEMIEKADAYVRKPIDPKELLGEIKKFLAAARR